MFFFRVLLPLLFLTLRSVVNGMRRAFTSPQRLIGLLVVLFYYFQFVARSFIPDKSINGGAKLPLELPSMEVMMAVVFGVVALAIQLAALAEGATTTQTQSGTVERHERARDSRGD